MNIDQALLARALIESVEIDFTVLIPSRWLAADTVVQDEAAQYLHDVL